MIGSFAGVVFSVSSRQALIAKELSRSNSARWAAHDTIGRKPKKEFLGPGSKGIDVTLDLRAELGVNPMAVAARLERCVETGTVSNFILGGRNLGRYVIADKSEAFDVVTGQGGVSAMSIKVTLEEYA